MELRGEVRPGSPLLVVALEEEAEHLDTDLPILIVGVGKLAASQGVLMALAPLPVEARPACLVNVGTAGALRDGLQGTHVVGRVVQHDLDGESIERLVGINPGPAIEIGEGVVLATGDQFIADGASRQRLAAVADLVDMEGYAIAATARLLGLEVELIKHVSDEADEGALDRWIDEVAACSAALGRHLAGR
jgi:adenosylhomocysteine nucleosidase